MYTEEEKARLSVARRQALCPRVPLGASLRGKWAAPHEENSPGVICAIASTRHLIQTMRNALDAREKATKKRASVMIVIIMWKIHNNQTMQTKMDPKTKMLPKKRMEQLLTLTNKTTNSQGKKPSFILNN